MGRRRYQRPRVKLVKDNWSAQWRQYLEGRPKPKHRTAIWPCSQYTESEAQKECDRMVREETGGGNARRWQSPAVEDFDSTEALRLEWASFWRRRASQRVYFARAGDRIKVGVSMDPESRMAGLRLGDPGIVLLGDIAGGMAIEKEIHKVLAPYRLGHEWFRWCEEVEAVVNMYFVQEGGEVWAAGPGWDSI